MLVVVVATAQAVTVLQRPGYPGMEATTMSTRIPAIMSDLTRPKQELLLTTPSGSTVLVLVLGSRARARLLILQFTEKIQIFGAI